MRQVHITYEDDESIEYEISATITAGCKEVGVSFDGPGSPAEPPMLEDVLVDGEKPIDVVFDQPECDHIEEQLWEAVSCV